MERFKVLSRLHQETGAAQQVINEGVSRFTEQGTMVLDVVSMTRDEVVPENVTAMFVATLEEMEPLPHIDLFILQDGVDALAAEGESFMAVEEIFLRNKWPGLFEMIQDTALVLGVCARDLEWIREVIAIVVRSARLTWRKQRGRIARRKSTVFA